MPSAQRALPPDALRDGYHVFTVGDVPLPEGWRLDLGRIAPWFEQPGGGLQILIHFPKWIEKARISPIEYLMEIGVFV
ncbi:TNT domain-containing protein [Gordonia alkaliphila]|uniref:TNT domain-containing protein n=1 Tax=Gordonia alkaliphila TaxID=1053547 RepID=UPI003CD07C95